MRKYIVRFVPEEYIVKAGNIEQAQQKAEKLYNKKHKTWLPAEILEVGTSLKKKAKPSKPAPAGLLEPKVYKGKWPDEEEDEYLS